MLEIDYEKIGARIKQTRKVRKLTQEKLGEQVGKSTSHISNIECGSTKASLPTLVQISNALQVTIDELLSDSVAAASRPQFERDLARVLEDCSAAELGVIADIAAATKQALRKQYE